MTATPDITPDVLARQLLDDLIWLRAGSGSGIGEGLREAVDEMLADYTTEPTRYSDGSEVWEDYWSDVERELGYAPPNPRAGLLLPPHRRTRERPGHTYGFKFCTADVIFKPIVRGPDWYAWEAKINAFIAAMRAGGYESGADLIRELDRRGIEHSIDGYNHFIAVIERETTEGQ